jgi:hypothetical protein
LLFTGCVCDLGFDEIGLVRDGGESPLAFCE